MFAENALTGSAPQLASGGIKPEQMLDDASGTCSMLLVLRAYWYVRAQFFNVYM